MMALFNLLPEAVGTISADGKAAIIDQLAARFASVYGLDRAIVLARIQDREKLGSTGFGRGVTVDNIGQQAV